MTSLKQKRFKMKSTLFKNRINWIQSIFSLALIGACSSVYALPTSWYDIPWEDASIETTSLEVKQMANSLSYLGTRRICGDGDHEYGVIMLHGKADNPSQGISTITGASGNYGNMNVMMEKFADDCALVYVPGAQLGRWDWRRTSGRSYGHHIVNLINYMHNTYSYNGEKLKIFLIGGSAGAVMAHHVARYHINHPEYPIHLAGVVIADGVSSVLTCPPEGCHNTLTADGRSDTIAYTNPALSTIYEPLVSQPSARKNEIISGNIIMEFTYSCY